MQYKSYIVEEDIDVIKESLVLFYGENLGLQNDIKSLIKKRNKDSEILYFTQDELLKNEDLLFNEILNVSLFDKKKVFLVTGRMSYKLSGAKETLSELLADEDVTHFPDFSLNPKLDEAIKGARLARCNKIEVIIAVGGGSVIDMAKLVKAFLNNPRNEQKIVLGEKSLSDPSVPLIVVPTTAGSGSEATHFAVVYIDDQKYSLASPHLQPNFVILDGSLIQSNSKYQKACNGLDALAQGIESAWAVNSSRESQKNALKAVKVCSQNLSKFVNGKFVLDVSNKMLTAANLSGQAINISKTTNKIVIAAKAKPHERKLCISLLRFNSVI